MAGEWSINGGSAGWANRDYWMKEVSPLTQDPPLVASSVFFVFLL